MPITSSNRPGRCRIGPIREESRRILKRPAWSCSRWGLPSRTGHPVRWCALTAPFHPYLLEEPVEKLFPIGGLFSVALSLSSRTVGVTHHRALWSPDFPLPGKTPGSDHSARSGHFHCTRNPLRFLHSKWVLLELGSRRSAHTSLKSAPGRFSIGRSTWYPHSQVCFEDLEPLARDV